MLAQTSSIIATRSSSETLPTRSGWSERRCSRAWARISACVSARITRPQSHVIVIGISGTSFLDVAHCGVRALALRWRRCRHPRRGSSCVGSSCYGSRAGASIAICRALRAVCCSRTALAAGDPAGAWTPAHVILLRGFMPGHDGPWIEDLRRKLDDTLRDELE